MPIPRPTPTPTLRNLLAACLLACSACVVGSPHGFSKGTNWSIPLIGGLEDGALITPVTINGTGPYLFFLNPNSSSIIDPRIAKAAGMYVERDTSSKLTGSGDTITHEQLDYAEARSVTIGDLTVKQRVFIALPTNATYHGQPVVGTIGAEFLSNTLIWTIDRDRQMLYLATQGHQAPPVDAMKIKADRIRGGHFFAKMKVDGKSCYVYLDLGQAGSVLRPAIMQKIGMTPMAGQSATDFFGRRYSYSGGHNAANVEIGESTTRDLIFGPFEDKRWRDEDLDGFIGRDFFSRFRVTVNWHQKAMWLEPRDLDGNSTRIDRLNRWGDRLRECQKPGCVTATLSLSETEAPQVRVERESAASAVTYEVLIEAIDDAGKSLPLPRFLVGFPAGATHAMLPSSDAQRYAGAAGFRVIDVTPFAPECNAPQPDLGCVWTVN